MIRATQKDGRASRVPLLLALSCLLSTFPAAASAAGAAPARMPEASRQQLPPPVVNPCSVEICMNSRISYHGGWSATATEQMLADVLHAASRAPFINAPMTIYAATPENVYIYDAETHSLVLHKSGNWRSDNTAAFEVGVSAVTTAETGAAMHLAQLESVAQWTGTAGQLGSCPRASATTYANANWNPDAPINIAISFGIRSVPGLTDDLVAISSDASLPDPVADGDVYLDSVLVEPAYGSSFSQDDLSLQQISRILWAAYGCSDHYAAGSKGGLVCASAVANYYLTRRVYSVSADGSFRYHNRLPPGSDMTTRDHRIEPLIAGDVRPALREAVSRLPVAPYYIVICVGTTGDWPEVETGFAAAGALLEASALGLQVYWTAGFSGEEQAGIRAAAGIPGTDLPWVVVSAGGAATVSVGEGSRVPSDRLGLSVGRRVVSGGSVTIRYAIPDGAADTEAAELKVFDCLGREVRDLLSQETGRRTQSVVWDCRDDSGRPVRSGAYFCRLRAGQGSRTVQVVVVR